MDSEVHNHYGQAPIEQDLLMRDTPSVSKQDLYKK